jgi:hypothetical protein
VVLAGCHSHMSSQAAQRPQLPANRLIVLGSSIGPVSLGERRATVRRALGPGKRTIRGVFLYFGGRLRVSYSGKVAWIAVSYG